MMALLLSACMQALHCNRQLMAKRLTCRKQKLHAYLLQ
jgi:hypothetical protein